MCVTCFNSLLWRNIVCEVFAVRSCLGIITEISRFSQCRKSRWNPQIDRSEVWNSWKPRDVSIKSPIQVIYVESSGWLLCGNSWKSPLRFPQCFQCRKSRWNPKVDYFQVWKLVKTPRGFHKISNEENLRGILRLTFPMCGNSWKPPVRFPQSFQSRKSMWNPQVDC